MSSKYFTHIVCCIAFVILIIVCIIIRAQNVGDDKENKKKYKKPKSKTRYEEEEIGTEDDYQSNSQNSRHSHTSNKQKSEFNYDSKNTNSDNETNKNISVFLTGFELRNTIGFYMNHQYFFEEEAKYTDFFMLLKTVFKSKVVGFMLSEDKLRLGVFTYLNPSQKSISVREINLEIKNSFENRGDLEIESNKYYFNPASGVGFIIISRDLFDDLDKYLDLVFYWCCAEGFAISNPMPWEVLLQSWIMAFKTTAIKNTNNYCLDRFFIYYPSKNDDLIADLYPFKYKLKV